MSHGCSCPAGPSPPPAGGHRRRGGGALRRHLRGGRSRDDRDLTGPEPHHRGGGGQVPGRGVPRDVPDAGQPGLRRPPVHRRPDRHHRGAGAARPAHRGGAARPPRLPRRRRPRRPQPPLRHVVPRRRPRRQRAGPAALAAGRHPGARPPPRAGRGPRPAAVDAGAALPHGDAADAPGARRRPRHRGGPPRAPRAGGVVRDPGPRRPARAAVVAAGHGQAAAGRSPPPSPRRLPVPGRRRPGALHRQGDESAGPRAVVLLLRQPPQGPGAAARDGRHRPHRLPAPAGGVGPGAAAYPGPPAPVQPPGQGLAGIRLREAHGRALPATRPRRARPRRRPGRAAWPARRADAVAGGRRAVRGGRPDAGPARRPVGTLRLLSAGGELVSALPAIPPFLPPARSPTPPFR